MQTPNFWLSATENQYRYQRGNTSMKKTLVTGALVSILFASSTVLASGVIINGRILSQQEKTSMEMQIGQTIVPGNYISDGDCWMNLSTGASGCLSQQSVNTYSRYGSGSYDGAGNWNVYSGAAGGAVGGTSDGCVYTSFGWSNC
jgi:hypothetical protein